MRLPHVSVRIRVVSLVLLLLLGPIGLSYALAGDKILFNFFASDSMYYMGVANNFVKFGFPTLDGETVTNGFHPLWQWMLMGLFKLPVMTHHTQIYWVFGLSLLLVYAAYCLIGHTLVQMLGKGRGLLATALLFPGAYHLGFEWMRKGGGLLYTLSPYSAVNGMESALSLLLWAATLWLVVGRAITLGLRDYDAKEVLTLFPMAARVCIALLVLTRLDDVLLLPAIGLFILCCRGGWKDKCAVLLKIVTPALVALVGFVLLNLITVGVALPLSASIKTAFVPLFNMRALWGVINGEHARDWEFYWLRVMPLLASLVAGGVLLALSHGPRLKLCMLAGSYLVLRALYLFCSVRLVDQGYWYYFTLVTMGNVLVACVVVKYLSARFSPRIAGFACTALVALCVGWEVPSIKWDDPWHARYDLWMTSDATRQFLEEKFPGGKLIEPSDGMFSYLLDMPAQPIKWFAASPSNIEERKIVGVWAAMIRKGFIIAPDYEYIQLKDLPANVQAVEVVQPPGMRMKFARVALK